MRCLEQILQNKANFKKAKMSVTPYNTKVYENICVCRLIKNKAKQSQFVFFTVAAFPLTLTAERDYNEIFS